MGRNLFILSSSLPFAESIKRAVESKNVVKTFIIEIPAVEDGDALDLFYTISKLLEGYSTNILRDSIALIDAPFFEDIIDKELNPLRRTGNPLGALSSMLIITFPEIYWFFPIFYKKEEVGKVHTYYWIGKINGLESTIQRVLEENSSFLFDCDGLRNNIRKNIKNLAELKRQTEYLSERDSDLALAIDEEEPYAYLHGYLAYRMGYRCYLVTTEATMNRLLGKEAPYRQTSLVFEDIFLNFPDRTTPTKHLSDLGKRAEEFPRLESENIENRIFVTVGHKHIPEDRYYKNKSYIQDLKARIKKAKIVYKPSGGLFNILEKSGLLKDYWKRRGTEWKAAKPFKEIGEDSGGHSAPGRLLVIAERLINRAENIFHKGETVQDCIHGATLALEAQELLGYRTPTTCLEAIVLRHKLEVKAECMFYGMEYNIDIENRIKEIEKEVDVVSQWFNPKVKKRAALNAQMGIVTDVMRVFRDCAQFDEEEECLKYFRKLNRQWYFLNHPWLNFVRPLRWYIETLVGSLPLFILALIGWPILFGFLRSVLGAQFNMEVQEAGKGLIINGLGKNIYHSFIIFFGLQPSGSPINLTAHMLIIILILGGFLHLGIFISYLYTLITRR